MVLLAEKRRLLWVGPEAMPPAVTEAVGSNWDVAICPADDLAGEIAAADLVLVAPPEGGRFDARALSELLDRIDRSPAVGVLLLPAHLARHPMLARRRGQFIVADADAAPELIAARIAAAAALQPAIRNLQADVAAVRSFRTEEKEEEQFAQLEEELRLAARLQRDFLPRALPQVGRARFASLFRPAGWVSGDIYDVFRLDETHVGFYVADVVGHGLPAALLTIFIKRAIQTKRIIGNSYEIISPGSALAQLNADICVQELTFSQFCTAVYGVLDTESLLLRFARGGHPAPLLLAPDGRITPLEAAGPLLGVFADAQFQAAETTLQPGSRLVVFSDGAEDVFSTGGDSNTSALAAELSALRGLSPSEMMLQLSARLDRRQTVHRRDDDVTIVALEITG